MFFWKTTKWSLIYIKSIFLKPQRADGATLDGMYESQAEGKRMSGPADGDT